MAGTIPLSLTQQFDNSTNLPLSGGKIYFIQAGTTSTPQNAYQDSGLDRAVKAGQGSLDPKGIMLTHLFSKDQLKKRDPISGLGMIKAPQACGSQGWGSIVKLAPPARPAAPVAQYTWQPNVQRASLPLEAAR